MGCCAGGAIGTVGAVDTVTIDTVGTVGPFADLQNRLLETVQHVSQIWLTLCLELWIRGKGRVVND